jgi:hypothetical protein
MRKSLASPRLKRWTRHDILLLWGDIMEEKAEKKRASVKQNNDYKRDNYDVIRILVPKGKSQEIKEYAEARDLSISKLICRALEEYCMMDLSMKSIPKSKTEKKK